MYYKITLLILYLLGSTLCYCQDAKTIRIEKIDLVGPDIGLSQTSNYFHFEDSKGFIWITALDNINRYDGHKVKVYNLDRYFDHCLPLHMGAGFAEDDCANIYIGSIRGIYKYTRQTDKFTLLSVFGENELAMPIAIRDGKLWCFNLNWEVRAYDLKSKQSTRIARIPFQPIASLHMYAKGYRFYENYPFMDATNHIWFFDDDAIQLDTKNSIQLRPLQAITKGKFIFTCNFDKKIQTFYAVIDKRVFAYDVLAKQYHEIKLPSQFNGKVIYALAIHDGVLAANIDNHFLLYDIQHKKELWIKNLAGVWDFGTHNYWFDSFGQLWLSRVGVGLFVMSFKPLPMYFNPDQIDKAKDRFAWGVISFCHINSEEVLVSNFILNTTNKSVRLAEKPYSDLEGYYRTPDSIRKGIWHYLGGSLKNTKNSIVFTDSSHHVQYALSNDEKSSLEVVRDLQVLPDGRMICATAKGLFWIHPETKRIEKCLGDNRNFSFKINVLSKNRIAVSYVNNSMLLFNTTHSNKLELNREILPSTQSFYVQEDRKDKVYWVASNEGIFLLDSNFQTKQHFNPNNGLVSSNIYGLLLDDDGNAWCSHSHGISSIGKKDYYITNYDKNDGIQHWDFNNRCYYKTPNGYLFFGGTKGINYFKPPLEFHCNGKPEVYIDEIRVNGNVLLSDKNINLIQRIEVKPTENNVAVYANILDLENAAHRSICYRLLGSDTLWRLQSKTDPVSFLALAPNTYTLELGCYDKFSRKYQMQKQIIIYVEAPFYKKWWFVLLCFVTSLMLLGFLLNRILKRKNQHKIEALLHIQALDRLETEALKAQINPHFVFNCLNSIKGFIYEHNFNDAELYLDRFSMLLRSTLNFSSANKIRLQDELDYIQNYLELELLRYPSVFQFQIKVDEHIDPNVCMIPSMLLQPFVENAIRHGVLHRTDKQGKIEIEIQAIPNGIHLMIKDNGIGRILSEKLNQKNKQKPVSKGMSLIQRLAELYQIDYLVEDRIDGTTVHLKMFF